MLFTYKTLAKSISVEFDIEKIEAHAASIIRGMNVAVNGTKIHNEVIDPNLIGITGENVQEQELIARTVNSAPFAWDPDAMAYLDNQLLKIVFYDNGTGVKNKYLNNIPGISSNGTPYKLSSSDEIVIKSIQFTSEFLCSGNVLDILDNATSAILYSLDVGATPLTEFFDDTVNIDIIGPVDLSVYVNNIRIDNPAVIFSARKVYTV